MRLHTVTRLVMASALLVVLAVPAAAQGAGSGPLVAAGLSFLRDSGTTGVGIAADAAVPVRPLGRASLSVLGDVGFNHFSDGTISDFGAGARVTATGAGQVTPFGQITIGAVHCCGQTHMALTPGFGVNVVLTETLDVRGQVDVRHVYAGSGYGFNETRFWFGVAVRPGTR